jgi:hypothetical protein
MSTKDPNSETHPNHSRGIPSKYPGDPVKIPVAMRAVVQRLDRRLAKAGEVLVKDRWSGAWRVVNFNTATVVRTNVDPEKEARELGVLRPSEEVEHAT